MWWELICWAFGHRGAMNDRIAYCLGCDRYWHVTVVPERAVDHFVSVGMQTLGRGRR